MRTFDEVAALPVRTPITLLEVDLDFCQRTFGSAPCTGTGAPCYNTRGTCKALAAYLAAPKTYRIGSANARAVPLHTQHVTNPDFAVDTAAWWAGTDATIARTTTPGEFFSGVAALKIVTGGSYAYAGAIYNGFATMIPGVPYRARIRLTSNGAPHVSFGATGSWELDLVYSGIGWRELEGVFIPSAGDLNLWIWCGQAATIFVDDVRIVGPSTSLTDPIRPYLVNYRPLATEIKSNLTVNGRVSVECYDEPDDDVGLDPYLDTVWQVASGSVTRANCRLSLAPDLAFVDLVGVNLAPYADGAHKIVIADGAGKTVTGWLAAPGTGETLGAEKLANGSFASDTAWTKATGWTISGGKANWNTDNQWRNLSQAHGLASGALLRFALDVDAISLPYLRVYIDWSGSFPWEAGLYDTTGSKGGYYAIQGGGSGLLDIQAPYDGASTGTIDNASIRQVLTPSATGATIVHAKGGAARVWIEETGFRRNDPNGYTFTVYAARPAPRGTFWRKLIARNPHYKGRPARLFDGFAEIDLSEYRERWRGDLDTVTLGKLGVKLEVVDQLKALDKVDVPAKVDAKLVTDIDASALSLTVTDAEILNLGGQTVDGSFEAGEEFWNQKSGAVASVVNDANARTGLWCAKITGTGWIATTARIEVVAGETFFLSAFAKSSASADGTATLAVSWYDASGAWISSAYIASSLSPGTTYREVAGTLTAPAGTTSVAIICVTQTQSAGEWYFDDVLGFVLGRTFVRIDDEFLAVSAVARESNLLTIPTGGRGAQETAAAEHNAKTKVEPTVYFPLADPFDRLKSLLLYTARVPAENIDLAAFDRERDFLPSGLKVRATIAAPTKLATIFYELVDLVDCKCWVGEDLRITIRRNLPNIPGRAYATITDGANLAAGSAAVDLNPKSRISRALLYWAKKTLADDEDVAGYRHIDAAQDKDAESEPEYGEVATKEFFCRWLHDDSAATEEALANYVRVLLARRVRLNRDPSPILTLDVELKDAGIKTGAYVALTTDELQTPDGAPFSRVCEVVKREPKEKTIKLSLLATPPFRIGYVAPSGTPDYGAATEQEKRDYAFAGSVDGTIDGDIGYRAL